MCTFVHAYVCASASMQVSVWVFWLAGDTILLLRRHKLRCCPLNLNQLQPGEWRVPLPCQLQCSLQAAACGTPVSPHRTCSAACGLIAD